MITKLWLQGAEFARGTRDLLWCLEDPLPDWGMSHVLVLCNVLMSILWLQGAEFARGAGDLLWCVEEPLLGCLGTAAPKCCLLAIS